VVQLDATVMAVVQVLAHPLAPVTVAVYVPEAETVAVAVDCEVDVFQE